MKITIYVEKNQSPNQIAAQVQQIVEGQTGKSCIVKVK